MQASAVITVSVILVSFRRRTLPRTLDGKKASSDSESSDLTCFNQYCKVCVASGQAHETVLLIQVLIVL